MVQASVANNPEGGRRAKTVSTRSVQAFFRREGNTQARACKKGKLHRAIVLSYFTLVRLLPSDVNEER